MNLKQHQAIMKRFVLLEQYQRRSRVKLVNHFYHWILRIRNSLTLAQQDLAKNHYPSYFLGLPALCQQADSLNEGDKSRRAALYTTTPHPLLPPFITRNNNAHNT